MTVLKPPFSVVLTSYLSYGLPEEAMMKIAEQDLDANLSIVETDKRRILVSPDIIPYIVKRPNL